MKKPDTIYKLSIVVLLVICFLGSNAQTIDSVWITKVPVKSGVIIPLSPKNGRSACPMSDGITIQSKEDTVYATDAGVVRHVATIADFQTIMFKYRKVLLVYSNLKEIFVAKGDSVKPGQAFGRIKKEDDQFELGFMIVNKNGDYWSHDKLLDFLKKRNIINQSVNKKFVTAQLVELFL